MLATAASSLLIILVLHYLYLFLRDALTVPKIRDMVRKPQARCSEMLDIADRAKPVMPDMRSQPAPPDQSSMKAELGAFLRDLKREEPRTLEAPARI